MVPQLTVRIRRTFHPNKVRGSDRGSNTSYASVTIFKVRHEDADFLPVLAKHLIEQEIPAEHLNRDALAASPFLDSQWPKQIRTQLNPGEFTFLVWRGWHLDTGWKFIYPSIGAIERLGQHLQFKRSTHPFEAPYGAGAGRIEIRMDAPSKTLFKQFIKIHKPHGSPFKLVSTPVWELGRYK